MSFLQRELDFSKDVATAEQIIAAFAPEDREIRGHRRPTRFTKLQHVALVMTTAAASFLVTGGVDARQMSIQTAMNRTAGASDLFRTPTNQPLQLSVAAPVGHVREGNRVSRSMARRLVRKAKRAALPRSRPIVPSWRIPVRRGNTSSCFGPRWGTVHQGVDIAAPTGTPIYSAGPGVVIQAGWRFSGFGYSVVVDHGDWLTIYGHASRVLVRAGQRVTAQTKIALVGSTGDSTGPHLHLGVTRGSFSSMWNNFVNPTPWLRSRGVRVGC